MDDQFPTRVKVGTMESFNWLPHIIFGIQFCLALFFASAITSIIMCCSFMRRIQEFNKNKSILKMLEGKIQEVKNSPKEEQSKSEEEKKKLILLKKKAKQMQQEIVDQEVSTDYLIILAYFADIFAKILFVIPYLFWIEDDVRSSFNILAEPWKLFISLVDPAWDKLSLEFQSDISPILMIQCTAGFIVSLIVITTIMGKNTKKTRLRYLLQILTSVFQLFFTYKLVKRFSYEKLLPADKINDLSVMFYIIKSMTFLYYFLPTILLLHALYCKYASPWRDLNIEDSKLERKKKIEEALKLLAEDEDDIDQNVKPTSRNETQQSKIQESHDIIQEKNDIIQEKNEQVKNLLENSNNEEIKQQQQEEQQQKEQEYKTTQISRQKQQPQSVPQEQQLRKRKKKKAKREE